LPGPPSGVGLGHRTRPTTATHGDYVDQRDARHRSIPPHRRNPGRVRTRASRRRRGTRFAEPMPALLGTRLRGVGAGRRSARRILSWAVLRADLRRRCARATARQPLTFLSASSSVKSLRRQALPMTTSHRDDVLVDALVAWGGPDDVADRSRQLHAAGARPRTPDRAVGLDSCRARRGPCAGSR